MADTLRAALNRVNPNTLPDGLRLLGGLGNIVRQYMAVQLVNQTPATSSSYDLATVHIVQTDNWAPCASILWCFVTAGGVTGVFTPIVGTGAAPATTQVAPTPCGNIAFLGADAVTKAHILYQPIPGEVVEFTGPCTTSDLPIPTPYKNRKVLALLEAEALTGTVVGKKIILVQAAGVPATTKANLDLTASNVKFNNATDAVLTARAKILLAPEISINTALQATSTIV